MFGQIKSVWLDLQSQAVFDTVLSSDLCHYCVTGRKADGHPALDKRSLG